LIGADADEEDAGIVYTELTVQRGFIRAAALGIAEVAGKHRGWDEAAIDSNRLAVPHRCKLVHCRSMILKAFREFKIAPAYLAE
jgi:hypothetical protein